jgi:cobalamin-dependent methionine synthase I
MIIIGEKINATIKRVKAMVESRDEQALIQLATAQAEAGADIIDVNVGTGSGTRADEIEAMQWAVALIQQHVDKPLCIDSADSAVIEAGLRAMDNRRRMINSVKAEQDNMDEIIPLAKKFNAMLVALPMDENGIPATMDARVAVCETLVNACQRRGFPLSALFFDPLVLPISSDTTQGMVTLDSLAAIKKAFPEAKTVMGLSNVSYGLPERKTLNSGFLYMAIYAGLDAVIANPQNTDIMMALRAGEVLTGKDPRCRRYARAVRQMSAAQQ